MQFGTSKLLRNPQVRHRDASPAESVARDVNAVNVPEIAVSRFPAFGVGRK